MKYHTDKGWFERSEKVAAKVDQPYWRKAQELCAKYGVPFHHFAFPGKRSAVLGKIFLELQEYSPTLYYLQAQADIICISRQKIHACVRLYNNEKNQKI